MREDAVTQYTLLFVRESSGQCMQSVNSWDGLLDTEGTKAYNFW